jgi:hypothetical protein
MGSRGVSTILWIWGFISQGMDLEFYFSCYKMYSPTNYRNASSKHKQNTKQIWYQTNLCACFKVCTWLVLIMLAVNLISHDKWFFYHFMSLKTIESETNFLRIYSKTCDNDNALTTFFYASGLSLSTSCLFLMSNSVCF